MSTCQTELYYSGRWKTNCRGPSSAWIDLKIAKQVVLFCYTLSYAPIHYIRIRKKRLLEASTFSTPRSRVFIEKTIICICWHLEYKRETSRECFDVIYGIRRERVLEFSSVTALTFSRVNVLTVKPPNSWSLSCNFI